MTLKDFLVKVHDRSVNRDHLNRAFKDLIRPSATYDNLDASDQEFIMDLIYKHRTKLFSGIHYSQTELDREFYRIWEKRLALGLKENDLKNIKEILHSFKIS